MSKTVIVDIDGTVADLSHRLHLIRGKKDYDAFYNACAFDEPIEEMCRLVKTIWSAGADIVFITGRPHSVYDQTRTWVNKHIQLDDRFTLFMRQNADYRKDTIIKKELFYEYLTDKEIEFVLEDRTSVTEMWRGLGLRVLQVASGDY